MDILATLGLNATFLPQLLIFLFTYIVFSQLLFKPYLAVFLKRAEMTAVTEATASQLITETKELISKYEFQAREVNDQISKVFDSARLAAQHEYDEIVRRAREASEQDLERARSEIAQTVIKVQTELSQEIPSISVSITNKLLGKEAKA